MNRPRGYPPHIRFLGAVLVGIAAALLARHLGMWPV